MIDKSIKDKVLVLSGQGKSLREIGTELKIGKSTVAKFLKESTVQAVQAVQTIKAVPAVLESVQISLEMTEEMDTQDFLNSVMDAPSQEPMQGEDAFISVLLNDMKPVGATVKQPKKMPKQAVQKAQKQSAEATAPVTAPVLTASVKPLEKGELIAKITLTVNMFENQLNDYLKPSKDEFLNGLTKKTQVELVALSQTMDYSRSIANSVAVMKSLTLTGAAFLEMGTKRFLKMKTDGFTELLKASDLENLLKELALENQGGIISKYQSPSIRFTTLVVSSLFAIDAKNRSAVTAATAASGVVPIQSQAERYQDL